jgi:hypothetical protein
MDQIRAFLRSLANRDDFAVAFNYTKVASDAIADLHDPQQVRSVAFSTWTTMIDREWTLELVAYERSRVPPEELHQIEGECVYIPSDLAEHFRGKEIAFENNKFTLR